jgi:hypothetical protein
VEKLEGGSESDWLEDDDESGLGARLWLKIIGIGIAAVVAALVILFIFGRAWYAWGFFGAFLVFGALLIGIGWIYDRRERNRRKPIDA